MDGEKRTNTIVKACRGRIPWVTGEGEVSWRDINLCFSSNDGEAFSLSIILDSNTGQVLARPA